jgi:hypothetical protein
MNEATQLLADKIAIKADELETSFSLIVCALQVFYSNKDLINSPDKRVLLDTCISYALSRQEIQKLTLEAQEKLISPISEEVQEGCREVEIIEDTDFELLPDYKAFKQILKCIVSDGPVRRLHIRAIVTVADQFHQLTSRYNATTVTEVILKYCKQETEDFFNLILMKETGFTEEQMLNVLAY